MSSERKHHHATENFLDNSINSAKSWIVDRQHEEGFWVGMLESNSCMEAQWVLAMHFLGVQDDPKYAGVIQSILNEQRDDGSWEIYHDAVSGDVNTTVECYAALRTSGMDPDAEPLRKARAWIFENKALERLRVFTKYWLSLIGEWSWKATPTMPPELILVPSWFPINIYEFSSWARATIVPLCILSARRPSRPLPEDRRLDELFPEGREKYYKKAKGKKGLFSWERLFLMADALLNRYVRFPLKPWRNTAIRTCLEWIIKHQDADGAWGGIQPPWIYGLMALHEEGYALDHPVLDKGLKAFDERWSYEKDGGIYLQASNSPVWDTVLTLMALLDCGETVQTCPAMSAAVEWILDEQVTAPGDWQVKVKGVEPGGWAFEWANDSYPDIDDTAVVIIVLSRMRTQLDDPSRIDAALKRAEKWVDAMQSANGGWAAFDKDNTSSMVARIPFCDFGEALDPPSVDVTAHVLEAYACLGRKRDDPIVARGLAYIRKEQEAEGSWFGRWGVNHIYGTAAVLPALEAAGVDMNAPYVRRAGDWVAAHQNDDGGWGETAASYMDDTLRGVGESTASQTAWALMALLSIDTRDHDAAIKRGVEYLVNSQADGTWKEKHYTGTGFPGYGLGARTELNKKGATLDQGSELARGFMINYNLYRHYFPLCALGRARRHLAR